MLTSVNLDFAYPHGRVPRHRYVGVHRSPRQNAAALRRGALALTAAVILTPVLTGLLLVHSFLTTTGLGA